MNISVVVVCYNEEKNVSSCLESLLSINYPKDKYEIIVSDGGSTDKTQEIVKEYAGRDGRVRLVIEEKPGTAAGRNAGIKAARYPYIAFTDADCEVPEDWLKVLAENFSRFKKEYPRLSAVGGGNTSPKDSGKFQEAVDIALDSFLGSFTSIQGRKYSKPVLADSLATLNVLYEKKVLEEAGLFDETLLSDAEDAEVNFRIRKNGGLLLYIPESSVYHKFRPTLKIWYKNMFRYGRGRARILKRHPDMWRPFYFLPLLFPLFLISGLFGFINKWLFGPFLYFPAIFLFSALKCIMRGKAGLSGRVFISYLTTHLAYSLGEYNGLFFYKEEKRKRDTGY